MTAPASAIAPPSSPAGPTGTERAEARDGLEDSIAEAALIVAPLWPIERFIAVNPLQGLTSDGFEGATAEARRWLGAGGRPGRAAVRAAVAAGVVDRDQLEASLACAVPVLDSMPPVVSGSRSVRAVHLALADLLHGHDPLPEVPAPRTTLERRDARQGTDLSSAVDAEVAGWCALLVDRHHGPGRQAAHDGAWAAWRSAAVHDRRLRRLAGRAAWKQVGSAPQGAADAVLDALDALGVSAEERPDELRGQLARLPGWAGYARFCDGWAPVDDPAPRLALVELLAIRLTCDAAVVAGRPSGDADEAVTGPTAVTELAELGASEPIAAPGRVAEALVAVGLDPGDASLQASAAEVLARCDEQRMGLAILESIEAGYRDGLVGTLAGAGEAGPEEPAAQIVCCIDVRSEGLRRHLEATGLYDTIGFAGFFGMAIRYRPAGSLEAHPAAPALLNPAIEVGEVVDGEPGAPREVRRAPIASTFGDVAHGPASMYALAEAAGWVLGPAALVRTVAPGLVVGSGAPVGAPAVIGDGVHGFTLDQRLSIAAGALRTMGLTTGFAPLVVLCGHGATTAANAHAASLHCGACGGNRGGPNARAAAAILNEPAVREGLAEQGIEVPDSTWFVAAEHDTTLDVVTVLADVVPDEHAAALSRLIDDLGRAGEALAADRMALLPLGAARSGAASSARRRAGDWAQVRPEWGLAGNAAFVVAPRDLTRGIDLGGRVFLHSYDAEADVEGAVLETILTAPMVVAHWISMQYFGSTVDPGCYGAGDKTLHNPVAGIGVLEGVGGDLRPGLPWQSVAGEHGQRHEPLRLTTLVVAPIERVETAIVRHSILAELFGGSWVHLMVRVPGERTWQRRLPDGTFVPHQPETRSEHRQ
jgi:uncharacterized protein YbcC (UPF0753/DUF2309 family)